MTLFQSQKSLVSKIIGLLAIILFLTSCTEQDTPVAEKKNVCPLGVCEGMDPRIFYPTKDLADDFLSFSPGAAQIVRITEVDEYIRAVSKDSVQPPLYYATYSTQTGVCGLRLDFLIKQKNLDRDINLLKAFVMKYVSVEPDKQKFNQNTIYSWSEQKLKEKYTVKDIVMGHGTGSDDIWSDIKINRILMFFTFSNYDRCLEENPLVAEHNPGIP